MYVPTLFTIAKCWKQSKYPSISKQNRQRKVQLCGELLCSNGKEQTSWFTHSLNSGTIWINQVQKLHTVTYMPCIKNSRKDNNRHKVDLWLPESRECGRGTTTKGRVQMFLSNGNVLLLERASGTWLNTYVKAHQTIHFKFRNYTICKLRINIAN